MKAKILALPEQYLVFKLGGKEFGFEARFLWEAATEVSITEVPRDGGLLTGVTQMHGKIIPVLDLAGLLDVSDGPAPVGFVAVSLPGAAELLAGFVVERVVGFVRVRATDILPPERGPREADIPYLKGWVGEGVKFPWLDIERLIQDQIPGNTGGKTI